MVHVYRRAASGDDAELFGRHRQEPLPEQPRPQPQQKLFQGREPQSLAAMRRLKNAQPAEVLEGKRKRRASTWLNEFFKVGTLDPAITASVCTSQAWGVGLARLALVCSISRKGMSERHASTWLNKCVEVSPLHGSRRTCMTLHILLPGAGKALAPACCSNVLRDSTLARHTKHLGQNCMKTPVAQHTLDGPVHITLGVRIGGPALVCLIVMVERLLVT